MGAVADPDTDEHGKILEAARRPQRVRVSTPDNDFRFEVGRFGWVTGLYNLLSDRCAFGLSANEAQEAGQGLM